MATAPRPSVLKPPANDPPLTDVGQHSHAWAGFYVDVANDIGSIKAQLAAKAGVTDGSDATAGQIGEYLTATASGVSLPNGTAVDVVTLALTAGDWQVSGVLEFTPGAGTTFNHLVVGLDPTIATIGAIRSELYATFPAGTGSATIVLGNGAPVRFSSAGAATAHLVGLANFIGSMNAGGTIVAWRAR
jgi:hypothetical protein